MCRQAGIPVTPATSKHQLCSLLYQKRGESEPPAVSIQEDYCPYLTQHQVLTT
jgi:hypothetical protein